ncbi:glycine/betaine ABC transporter substrate-binding protein [Anaerobacillus alkalidiazotrophicus]|uniref:Glycine/betaine ABC transporter substrate-binding protein n=1 Tax=Anaerobacillus alkalidiazotrophicus TaxID=472963 RepID=A0A1S2M541_9BACI|nr:glycine betaine ABC transporter substrate-binding protein [Anaerobacillus alkalidiazotrophicus]OIJ18389.1 glycine/betaine ABC transporter substrate-binding protein [Anaerobacillus alkalidiazotrophicus]OIJ19868.1 glycine/betaine ABC transporter substrate-binding protein [Anaerobacillus alkalidiazotrophicus]
MKHFKLLVFTFTIFALIIGCGPADTAEDPQAGDQPAQDQSITFGMTPWTSTIPPTTIAMLLLEDMGYEVNQIEADAGGVYTGLSRGDIDVFMDAWLPDMHASYMEQFGDNIDSTAISYPDGELGWVTPTYVEEINSIEDIKGNEDIFDGEIYGIEEGAGMTITSREMIEEFDLDLQYVASSEGGMLAQVARQIGAERPVVFLGWRPHPMFVDYDLKVLEGQDEFFATSEVHVLTNNDFKDRIPEAYEFLSNWSIDVGDIEQMIVEIDNGRSAEDVAREWIDNNQEKVAEMKGESK